MTSLFNPRTCDTDLAESISCIATSSVTPKPLTRSDEPSTLKASDDEGWDKPGRELFLESGDDAEVFEASDDETFPDQRAPVLDVDADGQEDGLLYASDDSENHETVVSARGPTKRSPHRRAGCAMFLNQTVCIQALARLLGVGASTLQNLREGKGIYSGRPKKAKHPVFGFTMDAEASCKWSSVTVFLWHVYHSCAEFMPTNFRMPRHGDETPFPSDSKSDPDFSIRYVSKVLAELHEYTSDVNVMQLGPGSVDAPKRFLQHSSRTELYFEYVAFSEANGQDPASFSVFLRVVNAVMKPGMRGAALAFRKASDHAQCDTCWELKRAIRAKSGSSRETAHRMYVKHILSQWLDRQEYWRHRSQSNLFFQQYAHMGAKCLALIVSICFDFWLPL